MSMLLCQPRSNQESLIEMLFAMVRAPVPRKAIVKHSNRVFICERSKDRKLRENSCSSVAL